MPKAAKRPGLTQALGTALMRKAIASEKIWGQRPGEDAFEIRIEIGTPYQVGDDPHEWACPVSLLPLYDRLHDARAGSGFHALCLASSLALDLLHDFAEKGGALFYSPGEDFPFEAYSFGIANKRGSA
ncbi:MAG: hypothetical protein EON58_08265 [Alphaproteobacteria bacterium]|nr:MAG: hypothetical protein EON58_08265 [Alphaproteobacteria bacterium]